MHQSGANHLSSGWRVSWIPTGSICPGKRDLGTFGLTGPYHSGRQASASTPSASAGSRQGMSRAFHLRPASSDLKRPRFVGGKSKEECRENAQVIYFQILMENSNAARSKIFRSSAIIWSHLAHETEFGRSGVQESLGLSRFDEVPRLQTGGLLNNGAVFDKRPGSRSGVVELLRPAG
jgi:hypothetical protein